VFHDLPAGMVERMRRLEDIDARDKTDGTPHARRLRQITPDTGRFLAVLMAGTPAGRWVEAGTSGGYSALWMSLACRAAGRRLTTFELSEDKAAVARETFGLSGVGDEVELVVGDARDGLRAMESIAFCFLDAENAIYEEIYELVVPRLVPGGLLVADNAIRVNHGLEPFIAKALADPRVDGLVVPVGNGELVCRKI
jgi:predicted O-methyltransferase YrrM